MLKELHIKNIILIESAEIHFQRGFNVLSGETGSGKSAIMHALSLIVGERSESSYIRHGAEKGIIEALFDVGQSPQILALLAEAGIDHESPNDLLIRRELHLSGKSRAFINNQLAQISFLKQLGKYLLEMVGQHANQQLFSIDSHRQILDTFGGLEEDAATFAKSWQEEKRVCTGLEKLINSESQRFREIEICKMEADELLEANVKEGEEEELFAKYSLLTSSEELNHKIHEILHTLSGERQSLLSLLNRQKGLFEHILRIDLTLQETARSFESAICELEEVAIVLRNYQNRLEFNPQKIDKMNARLTLINQLKRKYGQSFEERAGYLKNAQNKLSQLENAENEIEGLKIQLQELQRLNEMASQRLTSQRREFAKKFEEAVKQQLRTLNMPKVLFEIEMTIQPRNSHGDDRLEFFIIPNVGEKRVPIKDCASGGELSRILLAIQSLLAGKARIPTLIFDEIDANIGGETASIIGEKLREIGSKHQVICITHFPQVAKSAHYHLQISKHEIEGRTFSMIKTLDASSKEEELARMLGVTQR